MACRSRSRREPSTPRRSVYGFIERGRIPALLNAFDFASPDQHAPLRYVTTVPQQALFFLNSPFVAEQSSALANRSEIAAASSPSEKIKRMYNLVLGRDPDQRELEAGLKFVSQSAEAPAVTPRPRPGSTEAARLDAAGGRVESFTPFAVFVSDRWQGGAVLPASTRQSRAPRGWRRTGRTTGSRQWSGGG